MVQTAALEDLIARVGRLGEDLPTLARLTLNPVVVAVSGVTVLGAAAELRPVAWHADEVARRISAVSSQGKAKA